MDLFTQKSEVVQAVAKYLWPSPPRSSQEPLMIAPAEHPCDYIVPAMDRFICPTCGRDNLSDDAELHFTGAPQPENDDPNISQITRTSRSFRDLADGLTIQTTSTNNYSIPRTRAERRRRQKAARKSPYRDKPRLLRSKRIKIKPGETSHFKIDIKDFEAPGPGVLLLVAQPIKHGTEEHSNSAY